MSKKTRKKVARRIPSSSRTTTRTAESKSATPLSVTKVPAAVGKTYYSDDELKHRYAYVASDLKRIALIAVPMILGLIILSWFVKL